MSVTLSTAARPRTRPGAPIRHTTALARRWLLRLRRTPEALMDVIAQPVLFLLMFTFLFGGAIAGSPAHYAQFLVPGILVQTVVVATVSLGVGVSSDLRGGFFDRLRSLPISRAAPLLAAAAADTVRYCLAAVVTTVVGLGLGWRAERGVLAALAGCLLAVAFGFCISWLPLLVGLLARSPAAVQAALLPLIFPLTFLSSAFVPTETVPGWLGVVIRFNPVSQVTSTLRALTSGGPVAGHLIASLLWMGALLVVLVPCSIAALRRLD